MIFQEKQLTRPVFMELNLTQNGDSKQRMISLTDSAVQHLRELLGGSAGTDGGLRLQVEKGGCAGMQYTMKIDQRRDGDTVAGRDGVAVLVDAESLAFLDGSEIDYTEDLNDSGFKVRNPRAARSCGCGTSFEPGAAT
jgi:iron-sulfur cluster assembly accessory protein